MAIPDSILARVIAGFMEDKKEDFKKFLQEREDDAMLQAIVDFLKKNFNDFDKALKFEKDNIELYIGGEAENKKPVIISLVTREDGDGPTDERFYKLSFVADTAEKKVTVPILDPGGSRPIERCYSLYVETSRPKRP